MPANSRLISLEELSEAAHLATGPDALVVVGVDGPGGAGKSTFARAFARALGGVVVQGDDFYRVSSQRATAAELNHHTGEPGRNFDHRRLCDQVLTPARARRALHYQRYDWNRDRLGDWVSVPAGTPVVVEGVYTTRARLRELFTFRVFMHAPADLCLRRGLERDGEHARERWLSEWMPEEARYFARDAPRDHAHVVLDGSGATPYDVETHACVL